MWFTLAAAQTSGADHDRMARDPNMIAARMTDDQVAAAERRAREWTATAPRTSRLDRLRTRHLTTDTRGQRGA